MEKKLLLNENIQNLTSLWKAVSLPLKGYYERDGFTYYEVANSEWPNRLYFHEEISNIKLKQAEADFLKDKHNRKLSFFEHFNTDTSNSLLNIFELVSIQYGMFLSLQISFPRSNRIHIKQITSKEDALLWASIFKRSFNYVTSPEQVLLPIADTVFYLVSNEENEPIGTALTHSRNKEVVGIHSMGILPEFRRQYHATELMQTLLRISTEYGFKYAVLQASEMAVPLYEKLGFTHQFKMKNFISKEQNYG